MSSLYLIGFIQTLFLSILILSKKNKKLSDIFLFSFIIVMGLRLLSIYLGELGYYEFHPQLILLEFIYWPLFGPLLFLYIGTITSEDQKFKLVYLIHFIPAFTVLAAFSGYIVESDTLYFHEYKQQGILFKTGMYVWFYTTHFYFILCIIKLHRYRRKVKQYFSYKKHVDLKWLVILTYGFGIFLFSSLFYILTKDSFHIVWPEFADHLTWLIMVVYIFGIGFFGYKQKNVFATADDAETYDKISVNQYAKSKLDENEINKIYHVLIQYMEKEKPFLNCEFDLRMLSDGINTSPNKLSQVINSKLRKNFFEFVNEYRVNEAKIYLHDHHYANEKIMNIAYDCGFNSKSSFFSVFKKYTSLTPAQYKNSID